jgi:hypothetical protein
MSTSSSTSFLDGAPAPVTILSAGRITTVPQALVAGDDVWLTRAGLLDATGWEVKPEGLCRDAACIPLPPAPAATILSDHDDERWFSVTAIARFAGQPYAHESAHHVWSFGPPAYERHSRAAADLAPNFTLPDFDGRPRSLAEFAGKKIFLLTWASW